MKSFLLLFLLFISTLTVKSDNYMASDLTYTCMGGNTYLISFIIYSDCLNGPGIPTSFTANFNCTHNTTFNFSATLSKISGTGQDVTPGCFCDSTLCSGGTSFGVRQTAYEAVVTLVPCNSWEISVSGGSRKPLSNIITLYSTNWFMKATLNNFDAPCNSSPQISNIPFSFLRKNKTNTIYLFAIDANGDSLAYSFQNPMITATNPIIYDSTFSASNFITSINPITIDSTTGTIRIQPPLIESSSTVIRIEQWRSINGQKKMIGYISREMMFLVKDGGHTPVLSGIDLTNSHSYNPNNKTYSMQWPTGTTIDFDIAGYDADLPIPGCTVAHPEAFDIAWTNGIPNSSFTTFYNGTDSAYAHFHWLPTAADVQSTPHCFDVTISDHTCPFPNDSTFTYCLKITHGTGIQQNKNQENIRIFPNPSEGIYTVIFNTADKSPCKVEIYSVEGKILEEEIWNLPAHSHKLDLSKLPEGYYTLKIRQGNHQYSSKLIIKR